MEHPPLDQTILWFDGEVSVVDYRQHIYKWLCRDTKELADYFAHCVQGLELLKLVWVGQSVAVEQQELLELVPEWVGQTVAVEQEELPELVPVWVG